MLQIRCRQLKNQKGQSLFEVILALAISTLIIVALVALAAGSIRNASFSKNKTLATRYSQEATEWLRGQRDTGFTAFLANITFCSTPPHTRCAGSLSWGTCGSCTSAGLIESLFKRELSFSCGTVTQGNPVPSPKLCSDPTVNSVDATVKVSWEDSQGLHDVKSVTNFSDWRSQ